MAGALSKRQSELRKNLMKIRPGATPSEVRHRIAELCAQNDYDPVRELIEMVQKGHRIVMSDGSFKFIPLDPKDVISIHKEVLQYIAPKLRTIDVQASIEANINVTVTKYAGAAIDGEILEESEVHTMIRQTVPDATEDIDATTLEKMTKQGVLDYALGLGLEVTKTWNKAQLIDKIISVVASDEEEDDADEDGDNDAEETDKGSETVETSDES